MDEMSDARTLSEKEISALVDDFLIADRFDPRKKYDPIDDLARFVFIARELPGARNVSASTDKYPPKKLSFENLLNVVSDILFELNPILTKEDWRAFFGAVQVARHGGTRVRLRKRPALEAKEDAKRMTPKQMREKYPHLCRSRIYKLIKDASKTSKNKKSTF